MHAGCIQFRILGILTIGIVCSLIGCSGGGGQAASVAPPASTSSVVVSVNPGSTSLTTGTSFSLAATVSGTTDTAVSWAVDGIVGGNATVGTITGIGASVTYTAPAAAGYHVVTATSHADSSKQASSSIVVQNAASGVILSPGSTTITVGSTQAISVTISGATNANVTWTVDGVANGNATVGTITGTGNPVTYTAPATIGSHTITATSIADTTKSGSSTISVVTTQPSAGVIVAPNGVLGNPGTLAAPTTLEGAQTLIRNAISAGTSVRQVFLRGGLYPRSASLTLGAADSGTAANPVTWAAYPNEVPRLIGGTTLSPASFKLVDAADPNWSRLDPSARAQIYVADLTAYKTNLGTFTSRTDASSQLNQAMEVFVDGQPLTLARYPKAVDAAAVNLAPQATIRVSGTITPDATGDYVYKGLDAKGFPYYQLLKNGETWSIAVSATGPGWYLSNRQDLGGKGTPTTTWGDWETFMGPAGKFSQSGGSATGQPFLDPADGSLAMPGFLIIRSANSTTQLQAPDARMSRWRASEAMYYGFGYYSWAGSHSPLTSLDPATGTIQLSASSNYGLRKGQPFFLYNLLEELTDPGEYFIDRVNARLYLRPVGDVPPAEVLISLLQNPLVQMTSAQYITWQGVAFEASRDRLVSTQGCRNVLFTHCQFRNAGGYGLILNGYNNLVDACDFRQLGQGGIWVSGGDRASVTPSGTVIQNSEFQRFGRLFWTYQPGIFIHSLGDWSFNTDCIGITVQNNEIHHAPHAGLIYSGSGNTMQYNHIHDVTQWSNDAGALYTTGREWGTQGNLIKFNLIRNCGQSPFGWSLAGIYVDGSGSGSTVEANILYRSSPWVAVIHNGGRDVITRYNVFYGHSYGVDLVNFGSLANNTPGSSWNLLEKIKHFNYQTAPWSTAYPSVTAIPNDWTLLVGSHWLEPEGSVMYGNLQYGLSGDVYRQGNTMKSLGEPITWFSQVGSNLSQADPMFTDPANLNFTLKTASPMFAIPGFPGIDTTRIGIQK